MQQPASALWRIYRCDHCDVVGRVSADEPLVCWCCGGEATAATNVNIVDSANASLEGRLIPRARTGS